MLRNYEYRLYPSRKQLDKLYSTFRLCSELYNLLLAEHKAAYEQAGVSLTRNYTLWRLRVTSELEAHQFIGGRMSRT